MNTQHPTSVDRWQLARRQFFGASALHLGALGLASVLDRNCGAAPVPRSKTLSREYPTSPGVPGEVTFATTAGVLSAPHFPPRAKRVIYLFQAGGPSHLETFDFKPKLRAGHGQPLPKEVIGNQRLSTMSGNQSLLPMAGSFAGFGRHGQCGMEVSEVLPYTASIADDLCLVRTMHTEAINHDPAITFFNSGSQTPGRPSMGAWASYGLGSLNENLPAFIVLISKNAARDQPLYSRLWGSGFLPSEHQGVQFRAGQEPVLYLSNPNGVSPQVRRGMLDALARLNAHQSQEQQDPEIEARVAQAELAFRMQTSVPEAVASSDESAETLALYGTDCQTPGSYAANCLLARRLVERGVRFIQLFHQGWDQHGDVVGGIRRQCRQTDQPSAALVIDLKRRGLLDDTLVVWGGEFGRTPYCQGKMSSDNYGRDHHPRCFSLWLAGGGVKGGYSHGSTDEFGYNIAEDGVHVHDLHATMLRLLGVDHEKLLYKYQGRYFRLTDVHGEVISRLLA